jgi:hypothetical protein
LPLKVGSTHSRLEPCYFCLIGGWNPVPEAFEALSEAGIRTVVMVECSDPLRDVARRRGMNVVILPHYPFDSLGLNLIFDRILRENSSKIEIFECSHFVRIQRTILEKKGSDDAR